MQPIEKCLAKLIHTVLSDILLITIIIIKHIRQSYIIVNTFNFKRVNGIDIYAHDYICINTNLSEQGVEQAPQGFTASTAARTNHTLRCYYRRERRVSGHGHAASAAAQGG